VLFGDEMRLLLSYPKHHFLRSGYGIESAHGYIVEIDISTTALQEIAVQHIIAQPYTGIDAIARREALKKQFAIPHRDNGVTQFCKYSWGDSKLRGYGLRQCSKTLSHHKRLSDIPPEKTRHGIVFFEF